LTRPAVPCRSATKTGCRAMSAAIPAPTTSPHPCAGRCEPTRSTPWPPTRYSPRSPPARSPWRWPPRTRSPPATAGRCGPLNWPPTAPAMPPTALSALFWPVSRRTGWSPAPWRPGGRPHWPTSPRPRQRWPSRPRHSPNCPAPISSPPPSPTCPPCGQPPPPANRVSCAARYLWSFAAQLPSEPRGHLSMHVALR